MKSLQNFVCSLLALQRTIFIQEVIFYLLYFLKSKIWVTAHIYKERP